MPSSKPPLVVPIVLHKESEDLLLNYRRALEQLDGKADTDRFTDADLIAIAARIYMREVVREASSSTIPRATAPR